MGASSGRISRARPDPGLAYHRPWPAPWDAATGTNQSMHGTPLVLRRHVEQGPGSLAASTQHPAPSTQVPCRAISFVSCLFRRSQASPKASAMPPPPDLSDHGYGYAPFGMCEDHPAAAAVSVGACSAPIVLVRQRAQRAQRAPSRDHHGSPGCRSKPPSFTLIARPSPSAPAWTSHGAHHDHERALRIRGV